MRNEETTLKTTKEEILELIRSAEETRSWALDKENRNSFGYPYVCGYATATLAQIKDLAARL